MDYFVAHTSSLTHITQARGRYRGDLETLYVFDRNSEEPLVVPDEFLDIQLFHEDQQELRLRLSIKDAKGHYLSYPKQWERIETSGYSVDYGRNDNKRYVVIRRRQFASSPKWYFSWRGTSRSIVQLRKLRL